MRLVAAVKEFNTHRLPVAEAFLRSW